MYMRSDPLGSSWNPFYIVSCFFTLVTLMTYYGSHQRSFTVEYVH